MTYLTFFTQTYTCESGALARIMIPEDATEDDLRGIAEMLDLVITRHFKVHVGCKSNGGCGERMEVEHDS